MAISVTSDDIRGWSQLEWDTLGYGEPVPPDPDPLDIEVVRAIDYVAYVTGQDPDILSGTDRTSRMFSNAVQLRVEQIVIKRQADFVADLNEDAIDISVTGYQQKRISYKESDPATMINPWKELNDLLVGLLTEDQRDYWDDLGKLPGSNIMRPAEIIQSTHWFHTDDEVESYRWD